MKEYKGMYTCQIEIKNLPANIIFLFEELENNKDFQIDTSSIVDGVIYFNNNKQIVNLMIVFEIKKQKVKVIDGAIVIAVLDFIVANKTNINNIIEVIGKYNKND